MATRRRVKKELDPILEGVQSDILGPGGSMTMDNSWILDIAAEEGVTPAQKRDLPRVTEAREMVRPPTNITWNQLLDRINNSGLVSTTDEITRIGYLSTVEKDGVIPGIIEEVFLLPTPQYSRYDTREKEKLPGTYELHGRTDVVGKLIPRLSDDKIKSLKLEMYRKGLYRSPADADASLRMGAIPDEAFKTTLATVYRDVSLENFRRASLGRKELLDVNDYIAMIPQQPMTATETRTSVPSPGTSDEALRNQYLEYVGRAPSKKEFEAFRNSVRLAAGSRPTVTTTTFGEPVLGQGISDASSFTQEGFQGADISQMARQAARTNPESAPYQKATKYFDTFLSALPPAAGVEVGGADLEQLLASGGAG